MDDIPYTDLKIETDKPSGMWPVSHSPGITITHIPTGIMAYCAIHRSQYANRAICIDMILSALTNPIIK